MQQSKAYVIKTADRNRKATIAARKAEYLAYRYGTETPYAREAAPYARAVTPFGQRLIKAVQANHCERA